jgi:hypothetical protein
MPPSVSALAAEVRLETGSRIVYQVEAPALRPVKRLFHDEGLQPRGAAIGGTATE